MINLKDIKVTQTENNDMELSEIFITLMNLYYGGDIYIDDKDETFITVLDSVLDFMNKISVDDYIKDLLIGKQSIPLPDSFEGWEVNELVDLKKRDKVNRKLNKLTT